MNKSEAAQILSYIKIAYPYYAAKLTTEDAKMAINLWESMFLDDPVSDVGAAVKAYIASDTTGYAPAISQIKDILRRMKSTEPELTAGEAWALVSKAAEDGYYNSRKEFAKLPHVVQRALGGNHQVLRDYSQMDVKTFESVIKSQFVREYNAVLDRENEMLMLPAHVKKYFAQLREATKAKQIGGRQS